MAKPIATITMIAASLTMASPLLAQERSVEVQVRDLDLARPSSQVRLQDRIARAARSVCRDSNDRDAMSRAQAKRCEARAKQSADAQVNERIAQHKQMRSQAARATQKLASD